MSKVGGTHDKFKDHIKDHGKKGVRPRFDALWHLRELGVVEDLDTYASVAWDLACPRDKTIGEENADIRPVRVALIDTMVAYDHPNLTNAIDRGLMRDFSEYDEGRFLVATGDLKSNDDKYTRRWIRQKVRPVDGALDTAIDRDRVVTRATTFGAHGTAVAGLIGARPVRAKLQMAPRIGKDKKTDDPDFPDPIPAHPLPYCGINPFCRVVPIGVSASPDPAMLHGALRYALLIEPDVVVIADSWDRFDGAKNNDPTCPPQDKYGGEIACSQHTPQPIGWRDLVPLVEALSKVSHVLCAAGNEPRSTLVYPAALSRKNSGPWAVGACDHEGRDLNYSPPLAVINGHGHRMITTLSTEHPRYDRERQRLDPFAKRDGELNLDETLFPSDFPPWDIVTTDVPGEAGYNPSPYRHDPGPNGMHYEFASLYARFAGTSTSTAIAAGLVSLAVAIDRANDPKVWMPVDPVGNLFRLHEAIELFPDLRK